MQVVRSSALFKSLAVQHPGIEVWDDPDAPGGPSYFWIVSRFERGSIRIIAYVRLRDDQLERRGYDANGDDEWLLVE